MRILWLSPIPLPEVRRFFNLKPGGKGWWIVALRDTILKSAEIELAVIWASPSVSRMVHFCENNVEYYCIPIKKKDYYSQTYESTLESILSVIRVYTPDLVHVHGTEYFPGLVAELSQVPVVISIQGVLNECIKAYFGEMQLSQILRLPNLWRPYWDMIQRSKIEQKIISKAKFFIGRTIWDKSQVYRWNPNAQYFYAPEMIRSEFWSQKWEIDNVQPYSIYCTTSASPFKGIDVLIQALKILKGQYPRVSLRVGGITSNDGVGKYWWSLVERYSLQNSVQFLGYLSAEGIVKEQLSANIYVMPSYLENSSNGLCEAMVLGMPIIASYSGGTPSLVIDGQSGLLFPKGDAAVLAMNIKHIFDDRQLAVKLADEAYKDAHQRHEPQKVFKTYLDIYTQLSMINRI